MAVDTDRRTLREALDGADAFIGVSVGGALAPEMIAEMAPQPIIFAMANPDPEILPEDAYRVRPDAIVATGRSDYPNQVNNVLGFPGIFRGALDVRATEINEVMKLAAVRSLVALAKEPVPQSVCEAYGGIRLEFGKHYLIPKPVDRRVVLTVAPAVAQAAIDTGVARNPFLDIETYRAELARRLGRVGGGSGRPMSRNPFDELRV
ncbi:MAG: hypothetical protein HY075_03070 [Deltaproteobacteria bacterium]|nr:hypothetical protein [Deltaproteobacteria bacterium]